MAQVGIGETSQLWGSRTGGISVGQVILMGTEVTQSVWECPGDQGCQ